MIGGSVRTLFAVGCVAVWSIAAGEPTRAASGDPAADIAVCTTRHVSSSTYVTTDGLGGALVAWVDLRSDTLGDVYVQRIDSRGSLVWPGNGVVVCAAAGAQRSPAVAADGSGGAFVTWQDLRGPTPRVYVQRIDSEGQPVLARDGTPVCTVAGFAAYPAIAADGAGGVFIAWLDDRGGPVGQYLQRVAPDGTLLWPSEGVVIDTTSGSGLCSFEPRLLAAERGHVLAVTRECGRLVIRKFGDRGEPLWPVDGVTLSISVQDLVGSVADGSGGAVFLWKQLGPPEGIFVQRLSADGEPKWDTGGLLLFGNPPPAASVVPSGDGGAFVAWLNDAFVNPRFFVQRLDSSGAKRWGTDGIKAVSIGRGQGNLALAEGANGGLLMAWQMLFQSATYDLFTQRFDALGQAQWQEDGVRVPTTSQPNGVAHIEPASDGGFVAVWEELNGGVAVIAAKKVNPFGFVGPLPTMSAANSVFLWSPAPNPASASVSIRLALRTTMRVSLEVIDVAGRHVRSVFDGNVGPGSHAFEWDGHTDEGSLSPLGIYFLRCASPEGDLVAKVQLVR